MSFAGIGGTRPERMRNFGGSRGSNQRQGMFDPVQSWTQPQAQVPQGSPVPGGYLGQPDGRGNIGGNQLQDAMSGMNGTDFGADNGLPDAPDPYTFNIPGITNGQFGGGMTIGPNGTSVQGGDQTGYYNALYGLQGQLGTTAMNTQAANYQAQLNAALQHQLGFGNFDTQRYLADQQRGGNLDVAKEQYGAQRYGADQQLAGIMAQQADENVYASLAQQNNPYIQQMMSRLNAGANIGGFSSPQLDSQAAINQARASNARTEAAGLTQGGGGSPGAGAHAARLAQQRMMADAQASTDIPEQYADSNYQRYLQGQTAAANNRGTDANSIRALYSMLRG